MSIFERLREERNRLGTNQDDFAALGGVQKRAQINYEKSPDDGGRKPDAAYLSAIAAAGVDVLYVLTGKRQADLLSAEESLLVARYREASSSQKDAILGAALGRDGLARTVINAQGDIGQTYQVSGDVNQRGMTINMGGKKKG